MPLTSEERIVQPPADITVEFCPKCGNVLTKKHAGSVFCYVWVPRHQYPLAESH